MKAFCFIIVFIMVFTCCQTGSAQVQADHLCNQPQQREQLLKEHPEVIELEQQFEAYTRTWVENYKHNTEKSVTGRIIIPLVFHVINQGGPENISDAQIIDEVRIMNRDYNKQNADTAEATGDFKYIIADMGVEWRLATIDPNGNCTNGIDRITSDQAFVGDDYSKLNTWPRDKYVNVWLVKSMANGAAGYAYYPVDVATIYSTPAMDGVIILSNYIGSIGTSSAFTSRALTHEIGHCFNLEHCWGNTNNPEVSCGDDGVDDTPITKGWEHCPSPPSAAEVCTPGVIENYQNYMEYSYCSVMFTEGQKARWLAAANSSVAGRSNLWTDSNLIATGTFDTVPSPCAPIAHFSSNLRYVCAGNQVKFFNTSGNGAITSSLWHFPAGTTKTDGSTPDMVDTATNPIVEFHTNGWQVITLTVANSLGSSTLTDSLLVFVSPATASINAPYYQGFEDPNVFNENGWASINYDANNTYDDNITWFRQTNSASHTGSGCVELNNYYAHANYDIDQIVSPAINLSLLPSTDLKLSFYYSFATANQYLGQITDSIVVYASTNCGSSWASISNPEKLGSSGTNSVINAGYVPAEFTPGNSQGYWKQVVCTIPPSYQTANTHFMIQAFTTIHGNNLFIDDINIGNAPVPTNIEHLSSVSSAELFPNPTTGDATLNLELGNAGNVVVKVYDIAGQAVINAFDGWMNSGENNIAIQGYSRLAHGVYIVNIVAGESVIQKKLLVQ